MSEIVDRIKEEIVSGTVIPKPETNNVFRVKGWGMRRREPALIYYIPNHGNPSKPHEKGITVSEWNQAHRQLMSAGELNRVWFKSSMSICHGEGSCNFTTIGGIFQLLGIAERGQRGTYIKR